MSMTSRRWSVLTRLRRHEESLALRELGERVRALEVSEDRVQTLELERLTLYAEVGERMESDQVAARLNEVVTRTDMLDRALRSSRESLVKVRSAVVSARMHYDEKRGARRALDLLVERQRRLEWQADARRELKVMDEFAARTHRRPLP